MILDVVTKGTTNYSCMVRVVDSSDGTPETSVAYNTAGVDLWYRRPGGAHSSITEATQTEGGAHTDGGFVHVSDGYCRLDLPDAAVASGVDYVDVGGTFTGMVVIGGRIRLTDVDLDDAVRGGMTAMPNAAADAAGGLPISDAGGLDMDGLSTLTAAQVNTQVDTALSDINLDHLLSASASGTDVANDSVMAQLVSASGTADWDDFVNTTDSLQALRDRGDSAWTTGGGGSISDIISWHPLIPQAIDLANTKSYRLGIATTNMLDDLPTAAEITPGTISIDRAAQGGTSWSAVVTDAAMSESDGIIYYDEVFDTATGYASGDVLRVTLKGQLVTVSANDYELTPSGGQIYYTGIIADTPDVNIAQISGSSTAADVLELFALALNQGTGQLDSGSLTAGTLTAAAIQDGAFTSAKFADAFLTAAKLATDALTAAKLAADAVAEIQSGLATSAEVAALDQVVDRVEADTQDIQSRLPAALNNGAIPADVQRINDVEVVGDGSGTPFTV